MKHARHFKLEIDLMLNLGRVNVPNDRALYYLEGPKVFLTALQRSNNLKLFEFNVLTHRLFQLQVSEANADVGASRRSPKDRELDRAKNLITQLERELSKDINDGDDKTA